MLVGMCLFQNWEDDCVGKICMEMVKGFYDVISMFKLFLFILIMVGVCILICQFFSCVLIEFGDSLKGISVVLVVIIDYVLCCVGIGIGFGCICVLGSEICNGEVIYIGVILFLKYFQMVVKFCL